ncbi:MAG: glutamine-synthetase adenylyltransferase, partial [Pseudomonadota bacterium]
MSFQSLIRKAPLAHNCAGVEAAALYAGTPIEALAEGAAGCSPYLAALLQREEAWLREGLGLGPEEGFARCLFVPEGAPLDAALRQAKRRAALWIALADLGGVWSLEEVTGALTRLADWAVETALRHLVAAEVARGKLPEVEATIGGLFALAMGKMGAGELN